MFFQQVLNQQHGCASYIIASSESGEAAIVDPGIVTEPYETALRERGLRLRYVIDTHIHADHISGARQLASRHDATLCLHEAARTTYPFHVLRDGDELALGEVRLRVCHTPGHRPELISLLVIDTTECPEAAMVLTADALLAGDVGRPDFGGGDAVTQYESVARLLGLPDWVEVFPGHFEGPCGKSMSGRPSTTIGFERRYNPLARLERSPFIAALTSDIPARPLNMTAIEATNRGTADMSWAMLTEAPNVTEIGVDELALRRDGALVLDVREPAEYADGHVPGAVSVPQAELASWLRDVPRDRELLIICEAGSRSRKAAQWLTQRGYDRVASVAGGTSAWRAAGKPVE